MGAAPRSGAARRVAAASSSAVDTALPPQQVDEGSDELVLAACHHALHVLSAQEVVHVLAALLGHAARLLGELLVRAHVLGDLQVGVDVVDGGIPERGRYRIADL